MQRPIITLVIIASINGLAYGQQNFDNVKIKTTHVDGNIYMLEGRGGNIGVSAGADGLLIVDDQYAPLAPKIKAALKKIDKGDLAFVLNTHYHGDHVGGNPHFGTDATIIAHTNVRKRLETVQELMGRKTEPMVKEGLPVITFDQSVSVHFNGENIEVMHVPHGHTDGDSVVFFPKSNVVHMGDQFFNGMFPFVDIDHGGDVVGYATNVKTVIDRIPADMKIIPGHGPLANLQDMKNFHRMLVETTDVVRSGMAAGKSLKQLKKDGLGDKWKIWGNGFIKTDRWIETIQKSLTDPK